MTPLNSVQAFNSTIVPRLGIEKKLARRWLHMLNLIGGVITKGIYYDGHERSNVKVARAEYLEPGSSTAVVAVRKRTVSLSAFSGRLVHTVRKGEPGREFGPLNLGERERIHVKSCVKKGAFAYRPTSVIRPGLLDIWDGA